MTRGRPRGLPLNLYRIATALLEPLAMLLLAGRRFLGKEHPERLPERRGLPGLPRPAGPLAWLHGASVGETVTLLPLVERLQRRGFSVLVTSGTVTSAANLARRLPAGALHQFLPADVPRWQRRFLAHWRPDIAVLCESEIWPNLVVETAARGTPLALVNARMSARSFSRWSRLPDTAGAIIGRFDLCLAQAPGDGERLARLGAPDVMVVGNLKFDVPAPPADATALALLDGLTAGRPIWIASSLHPGEDEPVIAAHLALREALPRLLTIMVPRHPARGEEIAALVEEAGLPCARRAGGAQPEPSVAIYVADTIGELGLFYRLAPVVFMGGSLVPHGGQNPIEPAKLGAAILHGPHVHNFGDVYAAFDADGGARAIADGDELAEGLRHWLGEPAAARAAARAAALTARRLGGALDRTIAALEPWLAAHGGRGGEPP